MLLWRCNCAGGQVYHVWDALRCRHCGVMRDDAVRAERERAIKANLSDAERAHLEWMRERWARGEYD